MTPILIRRRTSLWRLWMERQRRALKEPTQLPQHLLMVSLRPLPDRLVPRRLRALHLIELQMLPLLLFSRPSLLSLSLSSPSPRCSSKGTIYTHLHLPFFLSSFRTLSTRIFTFLKIKNTVHCTVHSQLT